jgi:NAD(P)-dependent dehydrogenase (short-subunit alcohol dehydrogenase family)
MLNKFSLKDQNILITGASGLLGTQHAIAVAEAGGNLILIDIDLENLKKLEQKLNQKFTVNVLIKVLDITNETDLINFNDHLISKKIYLSGLINNAARNPKVEDDEISLSRLESFSINEWNLDISVGLTGAFLCAKVFGTHMAEYSKKGVILNVSSDLGLIGPDQRLYKQNDVKENDQPVKPVTYSVVKHGIIGLTKYLATYWPGVIRSNALCPGGVENNQGKEFIIKISDKIPMNRMAKKDEYQGTIIYMLSDASSYLNGAVIPVDGGRTAW